MFKNPFTPIFGGKPDFFFGRKSILARFDAALIDRGSEDRVLFITGSRGCGKTALLEQLSLRARAAEWKTVDVNSESPVDTLVRQLVRHDETTKTLEPELEVSLWGTGGRLKGGSVSSTTRYSASDLEILFIESCEKERKGIFVSIDEVQKVAPDDMAAICGAFQMASRKGHDVALAIAGLPYAHDQIIHHEGCTYMRRSVHEKLGLLTPEEVSDAFGEAIGGVKGLSAQDEALLLLQAKSLGHPYVMQLLGYYLVAYVNEHVSDRRYDVTGDDVAESAPFALAAYERRALAPIVDALAPAERDYLRSMAESIDEDHVAKSAKIAERLGKSASQLSRARQKLLREGIIVAAGRGKLMFNIPYLRRYVVQDHAERDDVELVRLWRL
ncbi:AAA family ATPase [Adlercreutzia sp. ZJ242]|uniref:AAA family ATPase n=1 Tax=Adlercreutzia sp. ZJ242 TaxID=2709409 RepID=UPI0013EC1C97|nr:AAA family ATPase [Adlercreutzia sp. ZJ242]